MTGPLDQPRPSRRRHLLIDALNLARGGGVVVMSRLALAFASAGYRVTVLAARDLPETGLAGSSVDTLVVPAARGALRATLYRRFRLNARAHDLGADAVLGFNYHSQVALPQVTYHINVIPFLKLAARASAIGYPRAMMQGLAARAALRRSTANMFESDYIRSLAARSGTLIRNPVVAHIGAEFVDQAPGNTGQRLKGPFLTVTSGARHKRNDLTLAFFRGILAEEPDAKLGIIGDTDAIRASLSPEDRDFVDATSSVTFHGYVGRGDLYALLAKAKALIVFSELESFFMVAIEAMSVGCPVIAADNSSIRESVGAAGLLVPAGDVDAAVLAARELDTAEAFARREKAGRDWASAFDANRCARDFVAAFERKIWPETGTQDRQKGP